MTVFFPDFFPLWAAAHLLAEGGNPYDAQLRIATMIEHGLPVEGAPTGFHNPPWTLWLFYPLGLLPPLTAALLWLCINISLISGCIKLTTLLTEDTFKKSNPPPSKRTFLIMLVCFFPALKTLLFGQYSSIIALALLGGLHLLSQRHFLSAGLAFSLCAIKPHIVIPFFILLLLAELPKPNVKVVMGLCAGFAIQLFASLALLPNAFALYQTQLQYTTQRAQQLLQVTLPHALSHCIDPSLYQPILIIGYAFIIIWCYRNRQSFWKAYPFSLCLGLVITPYAWSHDQLVLYPAYALGCIYLLKKNENMARTTVIALLAASLCIVGIDIAQYEIYTLLLPFGIMGLLIHDSRSQARTLT